jgi:PAS domain S-box-containing protein
MSAPVSPSRRDAAAPQRSHAPTPTSAETERDAYRRQLETLAENATLALFIMDEQQRCTYMNPAAERLTGFTLGELQGRALHYYVHHTRPDGSDYPLEECPIDRAFPRNMREQGTEVFVHKDGHFYPVAFTASPIREGGRTVGTIIEVRDIGDERVRAEEMARLLGAERAARGSASGSSRRSRWSARGSRRCSRRRRPCSPSSAAPSTSSRWRTRRTSRSPATATCSASRCSRPCRSCAARGSNGCSTRWSRRASRTSAARSRRGSRRRPGAPLEERFFDFVYLPLVEPDATGRRRGSA